MNINNLTARELVNYLSMTSTDPVVRRLIELLDTSALRVDLESVGLDPVDDTFYDNGQYHSPSEYIRQLRSDIDYYQRESDDWQTQCERAEGECRRLKARGVAEVMEEMLQQVRRAEYSTNEAHKELAKIKQVNKDLEDKINVWTILERT